MEFNFLSLVGGVLIFVAGIIVKLILDLNLAPILVKWLSYINLISRAIFRNIPPSLSGSWDVYWKSDSKDFKESADRKRQQKSINLAIILFASMRQKIVLIAFLPNVKIHI